MKKAAIPFTAHGPKCQSALPQKEIYECKCIMCCPTNENIQKYNQKIINY